MYNQWMILLAGMGTVFVALIAIIAMLGVFRIIFGKRPEKVRPGLAPLPEINSPIVHAVPVAPSQARPEGRELIAAITAAIAAATGSLPSAFQITSVSASAETESGFNTPVWGRIERFARK